RSLGVALVGGETAEMPGLYGEGDFDVVGVCVGACERGEVVTGEGVEVGDVVIGLPSTGLHTNGYTLARRVLEDANVSYSEMLEGFDRTIGEVYLEPHRAYAREILALRAKVEVHGMAHITGGGLPGNLPRALGGLGARLYPNSWGEPPVFGLIRSLGNIADEEMRQVFNLGVGFCAVVPKGEVEKALIVLWEKGCDARRIGEVVGGGRVEFAS
ncbi:MAG TPA: phosphoribosylformylglycinamidine cyclo-ligase, partial [Rubrobacteraceae bacterium]|nr:phosphoribosylformylglycinamidine cyclo-ligase [Rubrobacteraceae bacterium]